MSYKPSEDSVYVWDHKSEDLISARLHKTPAA